PALEKTRSATRVGGGSGLCRPGASWRRSAAGSEGGLVQCHQFGVGPGDDPAGRGEQRQLVVCEPLGRRDLAGVEVLVLGGRALERVLRDLGASSRRQPMTRSPKPMSTRTEASPIE